MNQLKDLRSVGGAAGLPSDQEAAGRSLGAEELARLADVIRAGTLTSTKGSQVPELERGFAALVGVEAAVACASGTAAIHLAVAAVDPEPGDEIVTSPVTDVGALAPILFQGAVPRFADVDPRSGTVTAATVEAALGPRTRAIVATHLFGSPCPMPEITAVAARRGIPVIEDCAQALLARSQGRVVGGIGAIGCFSLQQGKHITTGEGGLAVTSDREHARRMRLFANKAWPYGEPDPDHEFLALNYRMTELQGAVANAQLGKLESAVERRIASAERLTAALAGLEGVGTPRVRPGDVHTYWRYCLTVDRAVIAGGPEALALELQLAGVAAAPRYIRKPAFECAVFREGRTFGRSRYPFTLAAPEALDYSPARFPGVLELLDRVLVLPWNERYTDGHVDGLADAIRDAVSRLAAAGRR